MIHVLYHANCHDGFGAAWAMWRRVNAEVLDFHAVGYGEESLKLAGDGKLYLLDFSYPREVLLAYARERSVVVLDHHKTAALDLLDLDGLPNLTVRFDLCKSGAVLAWEHFHPGVSVPLMLQYVQDRDLWRFELPHSREVAAWMRSWPFSFPSWDNLERVVDPVDGDLAAVWQEGAAILRFQDQQVRLMADQAVALTLGGHKVHAASATCFFSEVCEELCRRYPDEPFAAYWRDGANGRRMWGLRSRSGRGGDDAPLFDCSALAKRYGGGGHPGAAGFETQRNWWGD